MYLFTSVLGICLRCKEKKVCMSVIKIEFDDNYSFPWYIQCKFPVPMRSAYEVGCLLGQAVHIYRGIPTV